MFINPFPNTTSWDHPKFKEAAGDEWNVVINDFEKEYFKNIKGKGENADNIFSCFHIFYPLGNNLPFFSHVSFVVCKCF